MKNLPRFCRFTPASLASTRLTQTAVLTLSLSAASLGSVGCSDGVDTNSRLNTGATDSGGSSAEGTGGNVGDASGSGGNGTAAGGSATGGSATGGTAAGGSGSTIPDFNISHEEVFVEETVYTMDGVGEREQYQVYAKQALKVVAEDGAILLYNLTPVAYEGVKISDTAGIVVEGLHVDAWTKTVLDTAAVGTPVVDIPAELNPVMAKFAEVNVNWGWQPYNFDPNDEKANWASSMTGLELRGFYTMNYNMAHFMSLDDFEDLMVAANIAMDDQSGNYANNAAIVSAMRDSTKVFNNWVVEGGPDGLGGGLTLGVTNNYLKWHYDPSVWTDYQYLNVSTWFHEFSHCFGFSHLSNMTYEQSSEYPSIPKLVQSTMADVWIERDGLIFPMADSPAK